MKPKHERTPPNSTKQPIVARKRFRIEKLEERIAPKKGGNSHHCSNGPV